MGNLGKLWALVALHQLNVQFLSGGHDKRE